MFSQFAWGVIRTCNNYTNQVKNACFKANLAMVDEKTTGQKSQEIVPLNILMLVIICCLVKEYDRLSTITENEHTLQ